ncbi:MAG: alpha/beta hydrolase-fold protein [Myxococcota bacterium]
MLVSWLVIGGCVVGRAVPGTADDSSDPSATIPTGATLVDTASSTSSTSSTSTTSTSTSSSPEGDLALVADLLSGAASPADVLPAVAWSGGWPVRDGERALVVAWDDRGPWSVAGDFDGWAPEPMTAGDGFSWAWVDVGPDPAGLGYKLVLGGTDWQADPFARSYVYDDFGELSLVAPPTDHARLDRWPGLAAEGLAPRDLRVWVPAGSGPWPVLYVQDGNNLFDPEAIWGGWRLPEALATRDPVLVVGIDNTVDRMDEYTHVPDDIGTGVIGGAGDAYAALVEDHVRPHIEATYGSTGLDGVMGSSLGGLISLHVAQRYPGRYDFVASLSGTLGWGKFGLSEPTVQENWLAAPPAGTAVYLDSGGGPGANGCQDLDGDGETEDDPDASDNYCETRQLADALAASGYTWDVDLWHWWSPDAPHNEAAWADRVGLPLDLFLAR